MVELAYGGADVRTVRSIFPASPPLPVAAPLEPTHASSVRSRGRLPVRIVTAVGVFSTWNVLTAKPLGTLREQ
jgi:hypothetical protein